MNDTLDRRFFAALFFAALLLGPDSALFAQPVLLRSVPATEESVPAPPKLMLTFNGRVVVHLSSVFARGWPTQHSSPFVFTSGARRGHARLPSAHALARPVSGTVEDARARRQGDGGHAALHGDRGIAMSRRGGVGTLGLLLAGLLLTTLTVVAEPRVIELTILAGTLPSDQRVIRVSQGDAVTLRLTSDRALTLICTVTTSNNASPPDNRDDEPSPLEALAGFAIEVHAGKGRLSDTRTIWRSIPGDERCTVARRASVVVPRRPPVWPTGSATAMIFPSLSRCGLPAQRSRWCSRSWSSASVRTKPAPPPGVTLGSISFGGGRATPDRSATVAGRPYRTHPSPCSAYGRRGGHRNQNPTRQPGPDVSGSSGGWGSPTSRHLSVTYGWS